MAFEYVVVKEEFESKEDAITGVLSAVEKNEPEHNNKNNKVEIAVLIPNNTRIKTELIDPPSSPDGSQTSNASWLVPIKEEVKEVLPEKYLEVTIKEEVPESGDDEPAFDGHTSDESAVQTSPTSSDELDHQRSGSFACDICGKSYTNTAYLQRHLQFHSKNAVQCNQCNRQFLNKLRLNTHIFNRHTLVTPYPCDQCPEKFKSKYYLREHKKTHSDEKAYQCSECLKSFTVKRKLQRHQSRTSCKKTSDDPIPCKICKTVFENESLLKSHMKEEHDSERSFPCDECSTIFKQKSTLMRHMHVHTGIRPYPCPHCGKTFTSSGLLKPHLRVHTGEKPYSCNICDKKFAHKHNMQRHMLGHEKIKHTVCDICHKEFPRESRLKYHMKTHVNEKYFMCKVCPKRFSHKQNVIRHYTRKHPGQTYQCTDTDASVAAKVWDTMKKRYCDEETEEILG